jgi:cytoskeleton protein RodZ
MAADQAAGGTSLGAELRAAREARDLTVQVAAQEMHVGDDIIYKLEQDDYAALGAPIFVHGHLRNYARLLGLEPDEVLARYDHATNRLTPPPLVTQRGDGMNRFGRRIGLSAFSIVVIAVLVVLAVVWWGHRPRGSETLASAHTGMPMAAQLASAQVPTSAGDQSRAQSAPPEGAKLRGTQSAKGAAVVTRPLPVPPQPAAHAQGNGSYSATEKGVTASQLVRAKFSVHQASWIEVYDAAGKRLYYNLAPAGDNIEISGAGPLQVFLGNAPGVSIEYNGQVFNQAPFTQPNSNTARFTLGGGPGGGKPGG